MLEKNGVFFLCFHIEAMWWLFLALVLFAGNLFILEQIIGLDLALYVIPKMTLRPHSVLVFEALF